MSLITLVCTALVLLSLPDHFATASHLDELQSAPTTQCESYQATGSSVCDGIVTWKVWYDTSSTVLPSTQEASQALVTERLNLLVSAGGPLCKQAAARYVCSNAFVKCEDVPIPGTDQNIALPNLVSQEVCEDFTDTCGTLLDLASDLVSPVSCTASIPTAFGVVRLNPPGEYYSIRVPWGTWNMTLNVPDISGAQLSSKLTSPGLVDLTMKCSRWGSSPAAQQSVCYNLFDPNMQVWSNATLTIPALVQSSQEVLLEILGVGTQACKQAAVKFMCSASFQRCDNTRARIPRGSLNQLFKVPSPANLPSRDYYLAIPGLTSFELCNDFATACSVALGDRTPDCSEMLGPIPRYPKTPTIDFPLAPPAVGDTANMTVSQMTGPRVEPVLRGAGAYTATKCPPELVYREPPAGQSQLTPCNLPCPSSVFTREQYDNTTVFLGVFSFVGIIGTVFVGVTYLTFQRKREFPGNMIMYFALASCLTSVGLLISGVRGVDVICRDEITPAEITDGLCGFQGFWMHYWALCTALWWCVIAVNLYLNIVRHISDTEYLQKYFHALCWGFPALNCVIVAANKKYGNASTVWCFIKEDHHNAWQYIFFYGWIGLIILTGVYCVVSVVVVIYHISRLTGKTFLVQLRSQARPLLFGFMIIYVFSAILGYRVNLSVKNDQYTQDFTAFVQCRLVALARNIPLEAADCPKGASPSFALYFLVSLHAASQAILITLFYGVTSDNVWSWLGLCTKTSKGSSMAALKRKQSSHNMGGDDRKVSSSRPGPARARADPTPPSPAAAVAGGGSDEDSTTPMVEMKKTDAESADVDDVKVDVTDKNPPHDRNTAHVSDAADEDEPWNSVS